MSESTTQIAEWKLVPVVAIESAADAAPLADALTEGGLPCAEITLRTEAGLTAIEALSQRDGFLVGAGTVHSAAQAEQAVGAGAKFVVSPGMNLFTIQWCIDNNVPIFPGISSPSDLELALHLGLNVVKFFPAEPLGGIKMLKALIAPYGGMRFMPTGGINQDNLGQYLALPQVIACGGSWMVKSSLIADKRFDEVRKLTAAAMQLVREAGSE
jgi:2-dehydro-3-deoxyphosphogluconate aldolase/(4S)-4-hydroxy-2-oxoglutarate aldolase